MTAPDNKPTSLREILRAVHTNGQMSAGLVPALNAPSMTVDEAIAALRVGLEGKHGDSK